MKKENKTSPLKKFASVGLAFVLSVSSLTVSTNINAYSGLSGEYSRYERVKQPSVTTEFKANELGVVNFQTKYGDKEANIASMTKYIEEADKAGVKVLLFPEMCVAGETPVMIDAGDCGKIGVSICFDTYSTPELERYYAAMECNILVNPTATGGGWSMGNMDNWQEYYKLRLESIASRDGFTILSSDLVGVGSDTENSVFPGGRRNVRPPF